MTAAERAAALWAAGDHATATMVARTAPDPDTVFALFSEHYGTPAVFAAAADRDADLHAHALAMVDHALASHDHKYDPQPGLDAIADALHGRATPLTFAEHHTPGIRVGRHKYDPLKHPKDKHGRWISRGRIDEARHDPAAKKELEKIVAPEDKANLEAAIKDAGHVGGMTKKGERQAASRAKRKQVSDAYARSQEIAGKIRDGTASREEVGELADHLAHLTRDHLGLVQNTLQAFGGRTKADVRARLVEHARKVTDPPPSRASATSPANAGAPTPGAAGGWMPGASTPRKALDNDGQKTRITGDDAPGVADGEDVAGVGGRGDQGGVRAGEPLGDAPAAEPPAGAAGPGEGVGGGTGAVPGGAGAPGAGAVPPADGAGDAPGGGPGTRPRRTARKRVGDGVERDADGVRLGGGLDGTAPAIPDPTPAEQVSSEPPTPENPTDVSAGNWRYHDREFVARGLKAKFDANLAAVRLLREIQAEGRTTATPEEQAVLSKFTGWGQFPAVFNDFWDNDKHGKEHRADLEARGIDSSEWYRKRAEWEGERKALRGLMSDSEWEAAKKSTLNAHYTHPSVVDAHWKMAQKLGFKGGRYLETSAGIGYYLGMMPGDLAGRTRTSAVELDPTTGAMLKLLYPATNVETKGFEEHLAPDGYYDLVASNVPFGAYKIHDESPEGKRYNALQPNIHDYFFLKSADKVKPGGLVMHVTSTGTLDKMDPKIREELAKTCDLVAAVRFPGGAHKDNAGTEVVTDMVVLRKRKPGELPAEQTEPPTEAQPKGEGFTGQTTDSLGRRYYWENGKRVPGPDWTKTTTVPDPDGKEPIPVNEYFAKHPEQVLGRLDRSGTMYRGDSVNVAPMPDYEDRLKAAIDRLPAGVLDTRTPKKAFEPAVLPAPGEVKDGGFHAADGKVFVRDGGALVEQQMDAKAVKRVVAHLTVRDALRAVRRKDLAGQDATAERAELNRAYDEFVKAHGPLHDKANVKAFGSDPDSPAVLALEDYDPKAKKATKTAVFTKPTTAPVTKVEKVGTVAEGLGVSLNENGRLDVEHVARLTGKTPEAVGRELLAAGLAFEDPSAGWVPADQYLSGNVRRKLALARAAAAADPRFAPNAAALEKVQPEDIHHDDIDVKLGTPWVPPADVQQFVGELLKARSDAFEINYIPQTGEWHAEYAKGYAGKTVANSRVANEVFGTPDRNFVELLEAAMNCRPVTVWRTVPGSDGKQRYVDKDATDAAMQKMQEIKDEFKAWVWADDARRERLHRHYNDNFNNIRNVKYDGSHLALPGLNPAFNMREHQKNFVWQVVTTGKGLAAHEVGMGKTGCMAAAAMELRRLGLAKKPAILCLKANIDGVEAEARHMYPGARILSTADMFDAASRKRTIARIATGDYDMVIMTHDHFDMLGVRPETKQKYIRQELAEVEACYAQAFQVAGGNQGNRVVKELAKKKEQVAARLKKALDEEKKDDAVHFEDLGIDQIFCDEAQQYKNLHITTKMTGMKGLPTDSSERSADMLMKCRHLQEKNGGRGVVFATGTPVSNAISEMYTMQRYVQPDELTDRGIHTFDAWANSFGDVKTEMEYTAKGTYEPVTRFAEFTNVPELMQIAGQHIDVQRADDLKKADGSPVIVRPARRDHVVAAPASDGTGQMMADLQARARAIKGRKQEKGADNMLSICTDGKKGSLDLRLLYADAPDDPASKTNMMVDNVLKLHKENPGKAQMVFCDAGVNPDEKTGFHLYGDVIAKLVKGGIPRDQIADFSNLTDKQKEAAVAGLRAGTIRVAIGSTKKLGTGVNAQDKLLALHHLDCPARPADIEQRNGRGWRQGNENKEVKIHNYVTEGSLDQLFWQRIAKKARAIKQVMTPGGVKTRRIREEDDEALSAEEVMAAASGDPRILEKVQVDEDVKKLTNARTRHERDQAGFKTTLRNNETVQRDLTRRIDDLKAAAAHLEAHHQANPDFQFRVGYEDHADRPAAEAAFEKAVADAPSNYPTRVGSYRGLDVYKNNGRVYLRTKGGQDLIAGTGTIKSVEATARKLDSHQRSLEGDLAQHLTDTAAVKDKFGKPFAKAADLEARLKRQKELEAELSGKGQGAVIDPGAAAVTTGHGGGPGHAPPGGWTDKDRVPAAAGRSGIAGDTSDLAGRFPDAAADMEAHRAGATPHPAASPKHPEPATPPPAARKSMHPAGEFENTTANGVFGPVREGDVVKPHDLVVQHKKGDKSWVAEINGPHPQYGLDRDFLEAPIDRGTWNDRKGTFTKTHAVRGGGVYEVNERGDKHLRVYYPRRKDGAPGLAFRKVSEGELKDAWKALKAAGLDHDDVPHLAAFAAGSTESLAGHVPAYAAAVNARG